MKIWIGILLDNYWHNLIRELQLDLLKNDVIEWINQFPHITLKPPFDVENKSDLKKLENFLETYFKEIDSFDIQFNWISYFGNNVAYLNIVENKNLMSLHLNISNELKNRFGISDVLPYWKMMFHSTIAYKDLNEKNILSVKEYLDSQVIDLSFNLSEIAIFINSSKDPWNDSWVVWKIFKIN